MERSDMKDGVTGSQFIGCLLTSALFGVSAGLAAGVCVAVYRLFAG